MTTHDARHNDTQRISPCVLHDSMLKETHSMTAEIHRRLFLDNGHPCIVTRLGRIEFTHRIIVWASSIFFGGAITTLVIFGIKKIVGG